MNCFAEQLNKPDDSDGDVRTGLYLYGASSTPEPETPDVKNRCTICSDDVTRRNPVTLRCLHTFCLACIKTTHASAIEGGQSDREVLYCPCCAGSTPLPEGSVEKIRPFFVANRVKDLHALSQQTSGHTKHDAEPAPEDLHALRLLSQQTYGQIKHERAPVADDLDTSSYTIEGPGHAELEELNALLELEDQEEEEDQAQEPIGEGSDNDNTDGETLMTPNSESVRVACDIIDPTDRAQTAQVHRAQGQAAQTAESFGSIFESMKPNAESERSPCEIIELTYQAETALAETAQAEESFDSVIYGECASGNTTASSCTSEKSDEETSSPESEVIVRPTHLCRRCEGGLGAVKFCFNCGTTMCLFCFGQHSTKEENSQHMCVTVSKDNIDSLVCKEHERFIQDYCITCRVATCPLCHTTSHENHEFREFCLEEQYEGIRKVRQAKENNRSILQKIEELMQITAEFTEKVVAETEEIDKEGEYLSRHTYALKNYILGVHKTMEDDFEKMNSRVLKQNDKLERKEGSILEQRPLAGITDVLVNGMTELDDSVDDLDVRVEEVALIQEERLLQLEEQHELASCTAQSFEEVELEHMLQPAVKLAMCTAPSVEEEVEHVLQPVLELKEHRVIERTMEVISELDSCAAPCCEDFILSPQGIRDDMSLRNEDADEVVIVESCNTAQIRSPGFAIKPGTTSPETTHPSIDIAYAKYEGLWSTRQKTRSVDFLHDGSILAVGRDELLLYDKDGGAMALPFQASDLQEPWKLAVDRARSRVAVVDPSINGFTILTPAGQLDDPDIPVTMCEWTAETHRISGADVPMAVAFTRDGDVVLGTGSGKTLLKYTTSGDLIWERPLAHECYYLTTDNNRRIITSGGGSVHVHDSDGNKLHEFPQVKNQLQDPWGVCTDNQNNIYVCELNRPMVVVFTSSGKYIREMEIDSWPRDVSLLDDRLLIGSLHSIEVYQLTGETV